MKTYLVIKTRKHGPPLICQTMWSNKARKTYERAINGHDDNRLGVYIFHGDELVEAWPW